jgi:predicted transcriptional regulator
MALTLRIPEELDRQLEALAAAQHISKHALLLQGASYIVGRYARRAEIDAGLDFVLSHDAELLQRLEDA